MMSLKSYKVTKVEEAEFLTLNQFRNKYDKGNYYVGVAGHALAVKDGVIYDHSYKPRRRITLTYKIVEV